MSGKLGSIDAWARQAAEEIVAPLAAVDAAALDTFLTAINAARRIALHGVGREGLMMRALAMRLYHLGLDAHVVGDMTTPPLAAGDLLIASAGPGGFATVGAYMQVAREAGATVALLTSRPDAELRPAADITLVVPARTMAGKVRESRAGPHGRASVCCRWAARLRLHSFCSPNTLSLPCATGVGSVKRRCARVTPIWNEADRMSFFGRRALITGAGKGIGRETARMLAARGATVVALSRSFADLASLQQEISCETIAVDLVDTEAMTLGIRAALPIDLLVNNAAIALLDPVLEAPVERVRMTVEVNMVAPLLITQIVAADLIARNLPGAIVNVSSLAAQVGTRDHVAYCASKAGLDAMTRVMALELGPHRIRVNSINPVVTLTPMGERAWSDPAKSEPMRARIPLGRFATPAEVAEAICFLLGEGAAMVNGVSLNVDGGFRAG